jgi:hypothetical protein
VSLAITTEAADLNPDNDVVAPVIDTPTQGINYLYYVDGFHNPAERLRIVLAGLRITRTFDI